MVKNFLILWIFASPLLISCNRDVLFADNHRMTGNKWPLDNQATFRITADDTASLVDISFYIRTGTDYPFRNIWLFVSADSPSGKTVTDTLEYMLSDIKGKRYGGGFGDIRELGLAYRKGVYFPEKGDYVISVRHGMRTGTLPGVYDLGIMVRKTGLVK